MMKSPYLRQFAALATAWREKYAHDLFFRTTVRIVALQSALILLCIIMLGWALLHPAQELEAFAAVIVLAVCFGALLARITLQPARDALTYQKIFISNVAHELRTPLSTIKTSAEVALMGEKLSPSLRTMLLSVITELDRISEIINNLLSLNALVRPERIKFENVDLLPIVERVLERHAALARERGIRVRVMKDPHSTVWGNATALEQIVTNLVKNALSYTPKNTGGRVDIAIRPDYHGAVVLSVEDTGIGLSQEDLQHIFEPFYRADTSRVRNIKKTGGGLGLTIVNEMVRAHHGRITVDSVRRKGTTISVFLPAGSAQPGTRNENGKPALHSALSLDFSRGAQQHRAAGEKELEKKPKRNGSSSLQ